MANKLHYADNGVHQCWTCRNCVGQKEFLRFVADADSIDREMIFILPECKVTGKYMTWVAESPCSKYIPWNTTIHQYRGNIDQEDNDVE